MSATDGSAVFVLVSSTLVSSIAVSAVFMECHPLMSLTGVGCILCLCQPQMCHPQTRGSYCVHVLP